MSPYAPTPALLSLITLSIDILMKVPYTRFSEDHVYGRKTPHQQVIKKENLKNQ